MERMCSGRGGEGDIRATERGRSYSHLLLSFMPLLSSSYPPLLSCRVVKHSYALVRKERWRADTHSPLIKEDALGALVGAGAGGTDAGAAAAAAVMGSAGGGAEKATVLVPLVNKGQTVSANAIVQREFVPLYEEQTVLEVPVYRIDEPIHDPAQDGGGPGGDVPAIPSDAAQGSKGRHKCIPSRCRVATLRISLPVGHRDLAAADRIVRVQFHFGMSEIVVKAVDAAGAELGAEGGGSIQLKYD